MTSTSPQKIILDCDTGIDDSFALLYLLAHPQADLVGLISTAGNVSFEHVHENNRRWLSLLEETTIPLYSGAAAPLNQPAYYADQAHASHGLGFAELAEVSQPISESSLAGAEAWIENSHRYAGELIALITGPLTTFATALQCDPTMPARLKRVVIMGGAFDHPGNTSPLSEWNIAWDPEALRIVLTAFSAYPGLPFPIFCPLDITEQVEFTPEYFAQLCQYAKTETEILTATTDLTERSTNSNPVIRVMSDALRFYFHFHYAERSLYLAHMHDPFAAVIAIEPDLATIVATTVDIELGGEFSRGKTIADWRKRWERPDNANIAIATDVPQVLSQYCKLVGTYVQKFN